MARQLADICRQRNSRSVSLIHPGVPSNTPETWFETDLRGPLAWIAGPLG
jgi:hypothetical protein